MRILVSLLVALATNARALDADGLEVTVSAETAFQSQYLWRGLPLVEGPVLQSWAGATVYGVTPWVGFDLILTGDADPAVDEIWLGLDYEYELESVFFRGSLQAWIYPADAATSTMEFQGAVTWTVCETPLRLLTRHYVDLIGAPGAWFGELGVGFELEPLEWLAAEASWTLGFANSAFNEYNLETSGASVHLTGGELAVAFSVGAGLSVTPRAGLAILLDADAREAAPPTSWSAGLALSGEW